jgi:hypothetical protein
MKTTTHQAAFKAIMAIDERICRMEIRISNMIDNRSYVSADRARTEIYQLQARRARLAETWHALTGRVHQPTA